MVIMNNKIYFIRHADKVKDRNKPTNDWPLSETGIKQAQELADSNKFKDIDLIYSSDIERAYQTAKPIADKLRKNVERCKELNELYMDDGEILFDDEFRKAIDDTLTHLYTSFHGWEPAHNALERFSKKIEEIDKEHDEKNILIVSHNIVIVLFFSKLLDKLDHVRERGLIIKDSYYNYIGIVQNEKVIQDVIRK